MNRHETKTPTHWLSIPLMIAAALASLPISLAATVSPAAAQAVPPVPPVAPAPPPAQPRQPRAPRAPRMWLGMGQDGVARIDTVVSLSPKGTVELSLISGSIRVSIWDRDQVRVVATTSGPPTLQFDASSSHVSLEQAGRRGSRNGASGTASYDVTVPAGARATLSAVSGSVDAAGIRGPVDVSMVSGSVNVRDLGSTLKIEGVSGDITATRVGNDVRVENVSGRVTISGAGGSVNAETVSGGIILKNIAGDRVHVTTVSGNIDFSGTVSRSGRYDFETHSGRTDIRLPSNASATMSVETFSGSVSNDYPGAVRRKNSDHEDDGTNYEYLIGRGDGRFRAQTFSGSVHISQGNP